ncbi:MAG TPA: dihydrolipoamide acetyltransferase family protein [Bacteroidota bacterium]|nr:dihydrolipoamide acetyltransferase family protein [Bacteroidota bacterium]
MQVEVVMPKMGESIQEGKILRWMKKPGDKIKKDETILEISTDKVDSEIPSPESGILTKIIVPENETVPVGTVIAYIETDVAAANVDTSTPPAAAKQEAKAAAAESRVASSVHVTQKAVEPVPARGRNGQRFYSPLVRTIAKKEGVSQSELDQISGTGIGGRVTKHDLVEYLKNRGAAPRVAPMPQIGFQPVDVKELEKRYPAPRHRILQMDNIQQKMAEHMVRSIHTSPHVQAIAECDVTRIARFRTENAEKFEKQEGFKLTFTPFFMDATVRALKDLPLVNSSVEGDKIIIKNFINLGMAVAGPKGLIVPVIKNAEEKNFLGLARAMNDIALRTRNNKLTPDDIQGGTFTITNYGVFGNIIGIPIINQPQVAILGFGAIKKRPVVITDAEDNDTIAIRSMVYLTLSFDHRILDGAIGGQFIMKVASNIENFDFSGIF